MCATTQYLFNCLHPATHCFRTNVCRGVGHRNCHISDRHKMLPYPCRDCAHKPQKMRRDFPLSGLPAGYQATGDEPANEIWVVPTRCFVDIGFRTLDPFRTRHVVSGLARPAAMSQGLGAVPRESLCETTQFAEDRSVDYEVRPCRYSHVDGTKENRELSPCCMRQRRYGAFQATRLEGYDDRIRGKIVDSFCQSNS